MAWQDRHYYRDRGGSTGNPLLWLLTGSVPLFTAFGIRVRAHASLVLMVVLVLLFGLGRGFTVEDRVQSMTILFLIVLLHEFGHCFAARYVGGDADEIIMHPLGGLALAQPPRRPLPTFITVAGGPAVNLAICLVCGAVLWALFGQLPWNPFEFTPLGEFQGWLDLKRYAYWIYQVSWMLFVFNMLPIFPLDGGQMLQSMLWPKLGYFRSMNFACISGMVGSVLAAMFGIATQHFILLFIAIMGFTYCFQLRRQLIAVGAEEYADTTDYSAAYEIEPPRHKHRRGWGARWASRRAAKLIREERAEQVKIDVILAKVSSKGMHSLTWWEKRTLHKATERQRQRDLELAREQRT